MLLLSLQGISNDTVSRGFQDPLVQARLPWARSSNRLGPRTGATKADNLMKPSRTPRGYH
eukprot:164248-Pyramimonas_sp.AAC.1